MNQQEEYKPVKWCALSAYTDKKNLAEIKKPVRYSSCWEEIPDGLVVTLAFASIV
ncbi:MAG: hypothetical protein LBS46_00090 [Dysgonamonadaceae bacterium]|jgi:hypothetical protein|nr:hypothetical protein [Dysgonamonadaceae bacterium]